jgi:hypothetical protein
MKNHDKVNFDKIKEMTSHFERTFAGQGKRIPVIQIELFLSYCYDHFKYVQTHKSAILEPIYAQIAVGVFNDNTEKFEKLATFFGLQKSQAKDFSIVLANFYKFYNGVPRTDEGKKDLQKKLIRVVTLAANLSVEEVTNAR